jgi:hypothetical protein
MLESLGDISSHFPESDGYCHPDWLALYERMKESQDEEHWDNIWTKLARRWLTKLHRNLGGSYQCFETQNFLLVVDASRMVALDIGKFAENALKKIGELLIPAAQGEGPPHVILAFSSEETYYDYISYFYGDGESPMSSGVYLSGEGYPHFAFPIQKYTSYRATIAHELTHACLSHLRLPLWLNEALAMRMEESMQVAFDSQINEEKIEKHFKFWNAETIQTFWSGESWKLVGDSNELSYSLATILWRKIEVDMEATREEIGTYIEYAKSEDASEGSLRNVFEMGLEDLVADFLGDGDWAPKPGVWKLDCATEE